jgi:hypothetical protein
MGALSFTPPRFLAARSIPLPSAPVQHLVHVGEVPDDAPLGRGPDLHQGRNGDWVGARWPWQSWRARTKIVIVFDHDHAVRGGACWLGVPHANHSAPPHHLAPALWVTMGDVSAAAG